MSIYPLSMHMREEGVYLGPIYFKWSFQILIRSPRWAKHVVQRLLGQGALPGGDLLRICGLGAIYFLHPTFIGSP